MTQTQLPEDIRKQIQQDLDKKYPFINNGNPEDIIATGAARAEYMDCAMKYAKISCIQKDAEIARLKELLGKVINFSDGCDSEDAYVEISWDLVNEMKKALKQ